MNPLSLTLKGYKGIKAGLGRDEITVNFETIQGQLIAIAGSNGTGKTTLLDNMHPYRIMPSRASSYSADAFSYFDQTSGDAMKKLVWEHDGTVYESTIALKNTGKTKKQECYLARRSDKGLHPVTLPDGTTSDGKTKSYDQCIEHILGTPEMFFTAAFSCQGRKSLSDYTNGDIKSLMSELLGLESILELGVRANEHAKSLRPKLDELRTRTARVPDVEAALQATHQAIGENAKALTVEQAIRVSVAGDLKRHNQRLAEAQAAAADHAATERRRDTLTIQLGTIAQRADAAIIQLKTDNSQRSIDAAAAVKAAQDDVTRIMATISSTNVRIATAQTLVAGKDPAQAAAKRLAEMDVEFEIAEEAHAFTEADVLKKRAAKAEYDEANNELRQIGTEGHALKDACAALAERAGLTDDVPCKGTDLQGQCKLLAEANAAKATLPAKQKELDTKRAAREALVAKIAAMAYDPQQLASAETAVGAAKARMKTLQDERTTKTALAARLPDIEAAAAALANDQAALVTLEEDWTAASARVADAQARLTAIGAEIAKREAELVASFNEDRAAVQAELDALPPTDTAGLQAAQQAVADAEAAIERVDNNIATMRAETGKLSERVASLEREHSALAEDVERMRIAEDDLAQWTLLTKALGPDGIVALCIDDAGPTLTALANDLLTECYGPRFSVSIRTQRDTQSGVTKEDFDIIVYDAERGDEKSLSDVSGGERIWINEAITRAIAIYMAEASGRTYGCLFSDESDGALDHEKKRQFVAVKRWLHKRGGYAREFFISHSPEVREAADAVIRMDDYKVAA